MTAHIVNADNPSPAPTHSVPGVPVVSAEHPSPAPAQSQPSLVPTEDVVVEAPKPVEVHDHAPLAHTENTDSTEVEQVAKRRGPKPT